ncbi:MAG: carboxypeptidase-like regulatory domain-containing protein [Bacteroidia bacterium]|nr:carboxypeptidase-like regulatory domain-containing protein [Bacteroidia bacterium]
MLLVFNLSAQFYKISGVVTNDMMEPIAFVKVAVQGHGSLNTETNIKGEYEIKITEGSYVLIFTFDSYKTLKMPVIVTNADVVQNAILEMIKTDFSEAKVTVKRKDISEEIIKKVIANKYKYMRNEPYSVDAYIKAIEENIVNTSKKKSVDTSKQISADTSKQKSTDTAAISRGVNLNLAEIYLTVHFSPPNKIKEERNGVQIRGSKASLFYLTHTDGNFDFYKNLIDLPALSEMPILSPISNSGLIAYKYKFIGSFFEGDKKYYEIKVQPSMMGNALVSGTLIIEDSTWCLKSLRLNIPKYHMVEYDVFEVYQEFQWKDSQYLLTKQEFNYQAKFGKLVASGRTVVYYSNYKLNQNFNKRYFNNELSSTTKEAYERDTSFWTGIRLEPFSAKELQFIRQSDSMKAIRSQSHWQDSTDSVFNRITLKKLFLTGQGNYLRSKEREWYFKPLLFVYTPVYIAGPRVNYWVYFSREYKNKKSFDVFVRPNYGLINKDLKGTATFYRLYDPFKRGSFAAAIGSDFGMINPYNSWIRSYTRDNFYQQDFGSLYHRIELFNGFYIGAMGEFANRKSIGDLKFDERGDSLWTGNNTKVVNFEDYKALYGTLTLSYVPFQKYIREPYQKLILGSKWPELSVSYRKGMNVMKSVVDFDYWELRAEQEVKIGLAGISKYRVVSGEFINTRRLEIVDYKFQRSTGPVFFANPLYSFQGLDTSFATFKRFFEGHYLHRFNGALINKIPLLKRMNIIEVAGVGALMTSERNLRYGEVFFGIEKVLRLWKERIRVGLFVVMAQSNSFTYPTQLKFTIESYNNTTNKWPY